MGEWKEYKLENFVEVNQKSISKEFQFEEIEYLDTSSITTGKIDGFQKIKIKEAPSRAKRLVKDNDIIYSTVRPIQRHYGLLKNTKPNFVVSTGFAVLTCNQKLADPRFIYYFLTQDEIVNYLDSVAEGSTSAYPSLTPDIITGIDINAPELPEQRSIASILSSLDDKIDLLHRQNKTLEALAETLFRQWFVEPVRRGGEADEGWVEDSLGNYLSVVDNRGKTPPFSFDKTEYPLIEANALNGDSRLVNYSVVKKYVDAGTFNTWFRDKLRKYDTLMTTVGANIGALAMYVIEKGNIAQNIIGLSAQKISPFYLYQTMKYRIGEISQLDIGGVQPSIKVPHLLSMIIPIPPEIVEQRFIQTTKPMIDKMENNYLEILTLESLRDTLLPKLMSGEVRVKKNEFD
ncbi:MAG TPA: restriction endonuclease subunit S [Ignavibacteriaceae bacterium]|nr:restriction endonuclease subunit S [Ignavibacteriaceae bacterium]